VDNSVGRVGSAHSVSKKIKPFSESPNF
jgi:hypothetical protein